MDSLLFVIGITIILIAMVLIVRNRRKSVLSEVEEYDEHIEFDQDMHFTRDEEEIIGDFSRELDEINYGKYQGHKGEKTVETKETQPREFIRDGNIESEKLEEKNNKELISLLHSEGLDENEIAKKLDIGKREVEIVLKVKGLKK